MWIQNQKTYIFSAQRTCFWSFAAQIVAQYNCEMQPAHSIVLCSMCKLYAIYTEYL